MRYQHGHASAQLYSRMISLSGACMPCATWAVTVQWGALELACTRRLQYSLSHRYNVLQPMPWVDNTPPEPGIAGCIIRHANWLAPPLARGRTPRLFAWDHSLIRFACTMGIGRSWNPDVCIYFVRLYTCCETFGIYMWWYAQNQFSA